MVLLWELPLFQSHLKDISAQLQIQDNEGMRSLKSSLDTQKLSCCFLINTHTPAEEEVLTF